MQKPLTCFTFHIINEQHSLFLLFKEHRLLNLNKELNKYSTTKVL